MATKGLVGQGYSLVPFEDCVDNPHMAVILGMARTSSEDTSFRLLPLFTLSHHIPLSYHSPSILSSSRASSSSSSAVELKRFS